MTPMSTHIYVTEEITMVADVGSLLLTGAFLLTKIR